MKKLAKHPSLVWLVLFLCTSIPSPSLKAIDIRVRLSDPNHLMNILQSVGPTPNAISIPFKLVHRLIAIEASVNNVKGLFLLDTGAQRLLLNQKYFDVTSLHSRGDWVGINGAIKSVYYKIIDSLQLKSLTIENQEANFIDLSHIEKKRNIRLLGIIGFEVLKDFEVFLDYPAQQIILSRLDKKGYGIPHSSNYGEAYDSLDFKLLHHLVVLKTEVNGVKLRMALDTGAELNLLDRLVRKKVMAHFEIKKSMQLSGSSPEITTVEAGVLHHLQFGKQQSPTMRTLITNLDHMRKNLGVWIDGLLGHEFLKNRRTLINYNRQKIYFFNPLPCPVSPTYYRETESRSIHLLQPLPF